MKHYIKINKDDYAKVERRNKPKLKWYYSDYIERIRPTIIFIKDSYSKEFLKHNKE